VRRLLGLVFSPLQILAFATLAPNLRVEGAALFSLGRNIGECPKAPVNQGNPCNAAQDFTVDCCQAGAELICPSIKP